jgi:hypothetical protein
MRRHHTAGAALVLFAVIALPPSLAAQQPADAEKKANERPVVVSQSQTGQSKSAPAGPAESSTPPSGVEWTRWFTGRQIPDPTGSRLFTPAISGGSGVR